MFLLPFQAKLVENVTNFTNLLQEKRMNTV